MGTYIYKYIPAYMYITGKYGYVYTCVLGVCVYMCVYMYVCMCVYVYICMRKGVWERVVLMGVICMHVHPCASGHVCI